MGFIPDVRKIIGLLPTDRQTLLFSATFSDQVRRLAADFQRQPAFVQVSARNSAPDLVRQVVLPVERAQKRALLSQLVRSGRIEQALVFTRTKHGASRLAQQLERDGIAATAIHGDKTQPQRVRALSDFKQGRADILVATDVAARGLDIDALPHVVNYELPTVAEDYLHRIGRTGRAGSEGDAVSLVSAEEAPMLADIERLLGRRLPTEVINGFAPADLPRQVLRSDARPATAGGGRGSAPRRRPRNGDGRPATRAATRPEMRPPSRPVFERAGGGTFVTMPGERFARR